MSFLDTLLGRKHPPMIGLDISSSSVKLVELAQTATGEYVLERFGVESFEKGWIADGQIEKFDEVAEAVKRVVLKSGTKTRQVVMAMPQSAVITKKIMLPAGLREEELELQVETEANQYIPFSLDEVSLDFCVIGPSATSVGDVEVLIAASRKDRVQDRQGLAEAAGLKPAVLDIESHASRLAMSRIVAGLPNEGKDALVALFEIGADTTSLKVLRDDEMLYDRDQAFGGSQLTQLISRQYGFSFEEAEQKKLASDLPEDYDQQILAPFVDSLSQEIGRVFGEMDLTQTQTQWEKAVSQASNMEERMEVFLDSMEQSAGQTSSSSTEAVTDAEIDRMIQADVLAAEKTELGKLDELESEIAKELGATKQKD